MIAFHLVAGGPSRLPTAFWYSIRLRCSNDYPKCSMFRLPRQGMSLAPTFTYGILLFGVFPRLRNRL